ncbi:MAG: zinc ribbon domain-containing protein [Firmicutes bacterium]|nr:zinc ribbon domain-containing protein [Bacillota bacterium]
MPIYEYRCLDCGSHFEILCKAEEKQDSPVCPWCGSATSEGIFAGFGVLGGKRTAGNTGCSGCKGGKCSSCH